jgi:hypothetical protein
MRTELDTRPAMSTDLPKHRDCLDCSAHDGMRLQNVITNAPVLIPVFYVCQRCRAQLTIPPPSLGALSDSDPV